MPATFNVTVDGDYSSPQLVGRVPKDSGLGVVTHYVWIETWVVNSSAYYPKAVGSIHPQGLRDPYDAGASGFAGSIFDLSYSGQELFLISETVIRKVGTIVIFQREYSSIPPAYRESELGYWTKPGQSWRNGTVTRPTTQPVTVTVYTSFRLGAGVFNPDDLVNYKSFGTNGNIDYNRVDYIGYVPIGNDDPNSDTDEWMWVYQSRIKPVIDIQVSRWKGEFYRIRKRVADTIF